MLHLCSVFSHGAETMDMISGRVVILRTVVTLYMLMLRTYVCTLLPVATNVVAGIELHCADVWFFYVHTKTSYTPAAVC